MTSAPETATEHAIHYASLGWWVFPCRPQSRHPALPRGHLQASRDPARVERWWRHNPAFEPAIVGGGPGAIRLLIVDIDGPEGEEALARLEKRFGCLPTTPTAKTRRGRHLYFTTSKPISTRIGSLGEKLDFKAQGGWVIAPPGLHRSGVRYAWIQPPWRFDVQPCPRWLEEALGEPGKPLPASEARALVRRFGRTPSRATDSPTEGRRPETDAQQRRAHRAADESRADFLFARDRLRQGASDAELFAELMCRPKARGASRCPPVDPERYCRQTIVSARASLGERRMRCVRAFFEDLPAFEGRPRLMRLRLGLADVETGEVVGADVVAPTRDRSGAAPTWCGCGFGEVPRDGARGRSLARSLVGRTFTVGLRGGAVRWIRAAT